jgi:hypothetical protein
VGTWDDVARHHFTDRACGFSTGFGGGLDGTHVARNDDGDETATDFFFANDVDVGALTMASAAAKAAT